MLGLERREGPSGGTVSPAMGELAPNLVFALALGVGVLCQIVAARLRIPSIVVLLSAGVALGPDGIGWIRPHALGEGLFSLVGLAVAVILFEGGLNLDLRRLRRESNAIRGLVTTGALVTAVGGALSAHWLMGWAWPPSVLFGTLVIVTGPTVIGPLLRVLRVRPNVHTVLEAEGVLIDPIGAILAALALEYVVAPSADSVAAGVLGLVPRLALGGGVGAVAGILLGLALRQRLVPEEFDNIFVLGSVLVLFELSNSLLSESGVLAVTVAGVVLGNFPVHVPRGLREFKGALTEALIGLLFVLLAADVGIGDVTGLGWPGLATVAALVFLVRPLNVAAGTVASDLDLRERAFIAALAPRGIVAAAIASLAANYMQAHGIPGGVELRALVFLTIGVTVVVQGGLAGLVARLLGVRAPDRDAVLILSAEGLGLALARELHTAGRPVTFLDANPEHCKFAQDAGFPVVYGNALEERTLARARPEQAEAVVGLTPNETVNSLFAREAREQYRVPEGYVAVARGEGGLPGEILERQGSYVLFDRAKDVARWNVRFRHGQTRLLRFELRSKPEPRPDSKETRTPRRPDSYVILTIHRGDRVLLMHAGLEVREDDQAVVALHREEEAEAFEALGTLGWELVPGQESV
jgi:NhaP-type Na+/H+ or K+/H+ antiporter